MKTLFVNIILLFSTSLFAQLFGPMNTITTQMDSAWMVETGDIDNDGDLDIIANGLLQNGCSWFENLDGLGTFGSENIIINAESITDGLFVADMDGDNDLDVLSATTGAAWIAWYENTDGLGAFSSFPHIIATELEDPMSVFAIDIDNDGDMDVLTPTWLNGKVNLYFNDGLGEFNDSYTIDNGVEGIIFIQGDDLDNDGDNDIVVVAKYQLLWYENTNGQGTSFTKHILTSSLNYGEAAVIADFNNDSKPDIACTSKEDRQTMWFKNLGNGDFSDPLLIWTINGSGIPMGICNADINLDGKMDLIMAIDVDNELVWFENITGTGNFSSPHIISTETDGPRYVSAADLDQDSDFEILSASVQDDRIAWFENLSTSVITNDIGEQIYFSIVPNPSKNNITINLEKTTNISIINSLGVTVATYPICSQKTTIDISKLANGLYFLRDDNSKNMAKFIKQ